VTEPVLQGPACMCQISCPFSIAWFAPRSSFSLGALCNIL
jgi:hypothetical protein